MRYLICTSVVCLWAMIGAVRADEAQPAPADQANEASATAEAGSQQGAAASRPDEAWRYKRHQGLWWYWLPAGRWVYWTGDRWVDYEEKSYGEYRAAQGFSRASRSGYSSGSGSNQWGPWGPIRYDRFGNRQYPYSMRNGGLQQLGPVPAMGGVRSLPGWGGER